MSEPDLTATIDAARNDLISAFAAEANAPEETAPDSELAAPEATAEVVAPESPAAPAKEPEARAYRKLLDGEAKLRAERKAYEAERLAHEAELSQYRAVKDKVKTDPIGYLIAAGLSDKEVLEAMQEAHARDLGNLAPPEVRAQLAAKRAERVANETAASLEAAAKAREQAAQAAAGQQFVAQYQAGITNFVTAGLQEFPQLAAVAAAGKPVAQAMYQTAVEMAQANPNGDAPTYAQVAKQLNAQLVELASFVAPAPTAPVTTPDPTAPAKPILRNSSTQAQPSPAPETTPKSYNEYKEALRLKVLAQHGIAPR
jgi:hypothetical protein